MTNNHFNLVLQAYERIGKLVHKTPVLQSSSINNICNAEIYFKCDNFQKTGSFKFRGASNAVLSLNQDERTFGVATHSSGNFAAALALAANKLRVPAHIVMPENAPKIKQLAVEGYEAKIYFCKPTLEAREEKLDEVVKSTGARFIHPYNDYSVIAGQGTAALELCREITNLDIVMAPVGGGGLMSGTCIAAKGNSADVRLLGAEPLNADDAFRSLAAGKIIPSENPNTIADGLLTSLGTLTYPILAEYLESIITVSELNIIKSMRMIWERMKIIIEPSAALPLGAVLTEPEKFRNKRIGIIISGGNLDLDHLPW